MCFPFLAYNVFLSLNMKITPIVAFFQLSRNNKLMKIAILTNNNHRATIENTFSAIVSKTFPLSRHALAVNAVDLKRKAYAFCCKHSPAQHSHFHDLNVAGNPPYFRRCFLHSSAAMAQPAGMLRRVIFLAAFEQLPRPKSPTGGAVQVCSQQEARKITSRLKGLPESNVLCKQCLSFVAFGVRFPHPGGRLPPLQPSTWPTLICLQWNGAATCHNMRRKTPSPTLPANSSTIFPPRPSVCTRFSPLVGNFLSRTRCYIDAEACSFLRASS